MSSHLGQQVDITPTCLEAQQLAMALNQVSLGLDLQIRAHPLRELVDNSIKGLMRQESDRQVSLDHVPDVLVLIDPEKIQVALNNLLGNALKYSPQSGQVSLTGALRTRDRKHYAVLEV